MRQAPRRGTAPRLQATSGSLGSLLRRLPDPRLLGAGGIGLIAIILIVTLVRSCVAPAVAVDGTMGLPTGTLFAPRGNSASFGVSLTIPARLAPRDPGRPTVSGDGINLQGISSTDGFRRLTKASEGLSAKGHSLGYVLYDVTTGLTISHNATTTYYGASSIKGPYVVSAVKYELGAGAKTDESARITNTIQNSDNAAYFNLRSAYGDGCFERMVEAAGIATGTDGASGSSDEADDTSTDAPGTTEDGSSTRSGASAASSSVRKGDGNVSDDTYEFYTPNDLLALWKQCYEFLTSDEPGAEWLGTVMETPINSAIRYTAQGIGTTWSKPGWYPGDDSGYGTTVDGGVVRTDTGDVIIAVMTDSPEDFQALEEATSALLACRTDIIAAQ